MYTPGGSTRPTGKSAPLHVCDRRPKRADSELEALFGVRTTRMRGQSGLRGPFSRSTRAIVSGGSGDGDAGVGGNGGGRDNRRMTAVTCSFRWTTSSTVSAERTMVDKAGEMRRRASALVMVKVALGDDGWGTMRL